MKKAFVLFSALIISVFLGIVWHTEQSPKPDTPLKEKDMSNTEIAVFGAGCFWCTEAVFDSLRGVVSVVPGYTGGTVEHPSYEEVCSGNTGHAEVARIKFNPEIITYSELLDVFWHAHDPTTLNRQGNDIGTQYRSAVFYTDNDQKLQAENSRKQAEASDLWDNPIVTEITELGVFYEAENYHHDYFSQNPNQPYCAAVIAPKVRKIREKYKDKLK